MNISGIIVATKPELKSSVVNEIQKMDNIEVHDASLDAKIVALIEAETPGDAAAIFKKVHDIDGVTNVSMTCTYDVESEGTEGEVKGEGE